MRRFDKIKNIRKANLLVEQRYLESKDLIKENDLNNKRDYYKGEDGKYYDNDNQEINEFMIGYANQYYTLWGVLKTPEALKYVYIKNLSTDLETAKIKANTNNVNEKLRGKTNTFYKVRFDNGLEQEVDEDMYKGWTKTILPFGKYKGESIMNIANKNPQYLVWLLLNTNPSEKLKVLITSFDSVKEFLQKDPNYIEQVKIGKSLTQLAKETFKYYSLDWTLDNSDPSLPRYSSNSIDVLTTMKKVFASKVNGNKPKEVTKSLPIDDKGNFSVVFKRFKQVKYLNRTLIDNKGLEFDDSEYIYVINVKNVNFDKYEDFQNYPDELLDKKYKLNGYFEFRTEYNDGTKPLKIWGGSGPAIRFIVNSIELVG